MHDYINERARKYHYWRGFRSACYVLVPLIIALMYGLNIALTAMTN